jgi:hypothetical protein
MREREVMLDARGQSEGVPSPSQQSIPLRDHPVGGAVEM